MLRGPQTGLNRTPNSAHLPLLGAGGSIDDDESEEIDSDESSSDSDPESDSGDGVRVNELHPENGLPEPTPDGARASQDE